MIILENYVIFSMLHDTHYNGLIVYSCCEVCAIAVKAYTLAFQTLQQEVMRIGTATEWQGYMFFGA